MFAPTLEELTNKIIKKFNNADSLETLSDIIPSTLTSDVHVLEAEKSYLDGELLDAFHHLSLTHSTLMYHRLAHKQYRPINHNNTSKVNETSLNVNGLPNLSEAASFSTILRPSSKEETKLLLQLLPSDWTVIQVTSESKVSGDKRNWKKINDPIFTPSLYISRCRCGPSPSIVIKKVFPPKEENALRSILQEMELIKGENKVISKHYSNDQEKYLSKREEINNRLKVLVRSMEMAWLRHWACLFAGALQPNEEIILRNIIKEAAQKCKIALTDEQLSLLMLMSSAPVALKSNKYLPPFEIPLRLGIADILGENVRSKTVKILASAVNDAQATIEELRKSPRSPIILVLDKSVVTLPWEMIQVLQNQSVTRMMSLHSLVLLYLHHSQKPDSVLVRGVDSTNGYYILDPENNLPRTQERLKECFFQSKWEGLTAEKPSHEIFKCALTSKDVFVYVGHGSGSQYMPAQLVETIDCRSLVFLYGCSSASLAKRGMVPDPWGVVLNYLIASCPCVVGMLWEVMDRDTDLLTREMVKAMIGEKGLSGSPLEDPPSDVALLVARARPLCSWYLISAALVVYGLPLHLTPPS